MIEIKEVGVWLTDLHLHLNNVSQFEKTIDQAVDYCVKNGIKYIFNGGDTFTSRKGQPQEVLKVFRDSLEKLRKAELTMYAITGNHDKTDYSSKDSFLIAFQDHPSLVLIEGYHVLDLSEGLRVHMVSFFEDGMYREILKKGELGKGKNICLTHVGISGAKMNSGISLTSGVNAGDFKMFDKIGRAHV